MTGRTVADAAGSAVSAADPGGLLRAYEAASMYYVQGETMEVIAHHLGVSRSPVSRRLARARQEGVVRVSLVQPGGAGSLEGRMAQVFGVRTISFPVPAFFDHVATREAMWSERSVKRVLSVVRRASLAVFGVGALDALNGALPSQVYKGGHLTARDQAVLRRQNVVGDVCTVLLRADGSWRDVTLNARATGPTPAQLARIPRRLCVAAGTGKARALLAALRARTATDLVVDDATARAVLDLAEARGQKGGGSR